MLPSQKPQLHFEMIQNYKDKLKTLRLNLLKSQTLHQTLKQQLLLIGHDSNTLFLSISSKTNRVQQLRSINPQKYKELYFAKEELKRILYKTEKHQIKLKEYEDRLKKFHQMYHSKKHKNQTLLDKIQNLQAKLRSEQQKQIQLDTQLGILQPKKDPKDNPSLKIQSHYLKSLTKTSNPFDEAEIQLLNTSSKVKKFNQEYEEIKRKNIQLKSNINKLQQQINSIQEFMKNNSSVPDFVEQNQKNQQQTHPSSYNQSRNSIDEQRILKISDSNDFKKQDRIKKPSNQLPKQIVSSLSNFDNLKSKSMLESLVAKHSFLSEHQESLVESLKQNSNLMSELTKLNSILESEIVQENSKLSAFFIRAKKFSEIRTFC